jgi:hypothetical protein
MHGKYVPANALLRRIMEIALTALYLDDEIRRHPKESRTYKDWCQKREAWVAKSSERHLSFTSEFGIMGRLIDPDTDYYAKRILNASKSVSEKPFRKYLRDLYSELCKFVHYGGLGLTDRFPLQFAEFDEKRFNEWLLRFRKIFEAYVILLAVKFPEVPRVYEKLETNLNDFERVPLLTSEQEKVMKTLKINGV